MGTPNTPVPPPGALRAVSWSTWRQAAVLILTGATLRTALPVAAVVGTLLCALNQGSILLSGQADAGTVARIAGNYAIPYLVSSVGFISAHRINPRNPPT